MISFDSATFRHYFPSLQDQHVYLDSAATALKPQPMIEAIQGYYQGNTVPVHRSHYYSAQHVTKCYEDTRQQIANLIHAPLAQDIIWTKGTTEAINLVAQSYLRPRLQAGDEILVCASEHHSNLIPWLIVAQQCQANVIKLPVNTAGIPDLSQLPALLNNKTRLLALGQMSNVTGECPDLTYAISLAHQNSTVVMVDGAQGIVHHPIDVNALDVDFYAFSAHKLYGPTGVGVLYGKTALLAEMSCWQGGGKMLTYADFNGFTQQAVPYRFEAGTPNIAGILGFSATLSWLANFDLTAAEAYSVTLADQAESQLNILPGFISYRAPGSALLAFNITGVHHNDLNTLIAEQGIALRAGQHCAQPLMQALGIHGILRASFAPYNTPKEVSCLVKAVQYALSLLNVQESA